MKSQKGITLTTLVIYVMIVLIIVGVLATITAVFQGNMKEVNKKGTSTVEIDKFNVYFLKDVKKIGNKVENISENEILFSMGNKYTFNEEKNCIYLNDDINIATNIKKCIFSVGIQNNKTVITVTIKAKDSEERSIEYVLANAPFYTAYDDENNYVYEKKELISYNEAQRENGYLIENAKFTEGAYTAVIPKGFRISEETGEGQISTGLVIQDSIGNEFVWIPVTEDLKYSYSTSSYSEPTELEEIDSKTSNPIDSQKTLDYYYGENYYTYSNFKYINEYIEMIDSVNQNDGFYIGRYETTIDSSNNIGSKENETVLTINKKINAINKEYRWYGLYAEQKATNVSGNGSNVQTAMIYGVLWDKTMEYIRKQNDIKIIQYDVDVENKSFHSHAGIAKSGQLNTGVNGDVALNIWDLESNAIELTQESTSGHDRVCRGGAFFLAMPGEANKRGNIAPSATSDICYGTRMILYIKDY